MSAMITIGRHQSYPELLLPESAPVCFCSSWPFCCCCCCCCCLLMRIAFLWTSLLSWYAAFLSERSSPVTGSMSAIFPTNWKMVSSRSRSYNPSWVISIWQLGHLCTTISSSKRSCLLREGCCNGESWMQQEFLCASMHAKQKLCSQDRTTGAAFTSWQILHCNKEKRDNNITYKKVLSHN